MRASVLMLLACASSSACLGPNPNARGDEDGTESDTGSESESGTDTGSETETGDPDPTCDDEIQNQDETDEDCGGEHCDPCGTDAKCADGDDCFSKVCEGVCQAAACNDEVQNGDEASTDCGGSCGVCVLEALHADWADPDIVPQTEPAVDIGVDGSVAIAWVAAGFDIQARWFHADEEDPGDGFAVHLPSAPAETRPTVRIVDADAPELVVAYLDANPPDGPDLMMHRFDEGGLAIGDAVKLDVYNAVQVDGYAFDLDGDTAIFAWHGTGQLLARRFDLASEDFLDTMDLDVEGTVTAHPMSLAHGPDGDFVVAWSDMAGDFDFEAFVRRRTSLGAWAQAPTAANAYSDEDIQTEPSVAALPGGGFVVVWHGATEQDPSGGIAGRILDADGDPTGAEDLRINAMDVGVPEQATVVGLRDGFAVAWRDTATDTVWLRRFDATGEPRFDDEAPWGSTKGLQPGAPAVAANDTEIVLVWSAGDPDAQAEIMGVRVGY